MTCRITLNNGHVINHDHLSAVDLLNKIAEFAELPPAKQVLWIQKDDGKRFYVMTSAIATIEEL